MSYRNIREPIKIINERLKNSSIKWALVGSANLQLQGMRVEPRDLDIVICHKDLKQVSKIFSDYSASAVKNLETLSKKPAWEVKAIISGIEVQFFGGNEDDIYVSKLLSGKTILVQLDEIKVPCFTLEAESQCYKETNRGNKARLIQEFLARMR